MSKEDIAFPKSPAIRRVIAIAWIGLVLIDLLIIAAGLPGYLRGWGIYNSAGFLAPQHVFGLLKVLSVAASLLCAVLSIILASILFLRKRQDNMAVFVSFYLLLYGVVMGGPLEAALYARGLTNSLAIIFQTILLTTPTIYLLCVFPTGHFVPHWSLWLVLVSVPVNVWVLINPDQELLSTTRWDALLLVVGLFVILVTAFYAQVYRYRFVSNPNQRVQTRWVLAGLMLWGGYLVLSTVPYTMVQNLTQHGSYPWWAPLASTSWWLSLNILPISLTIAILRSRLFDIDLLIRRTLVYSVLTGLLILVYFGSVVVFQGFFYAFTRRDSPLSVVLSTLAIAALFNPLRARVQDFIDRRFFRQKYNSAQALASFAKTARDEVELHVLSSALLEVIRENLQPDSLSLWLVEVEQESAKKPFEEGN